MQKTRKPLEPEPADTIVRAVLELLEDGGYDAVHLREVARRAQVSLATIYKLFATRDELIVVAVERWMAVNGCAELAPAAPGESLYDGLMRILRHVFEPWERSPRMLEVYHRAQAGPGGERLRRQAMQAIEPTALTMLARCDPDYADDVALILTHLGYAVVGSFAAQKIDITEILPILERTVHRLTTDNRTVAGARPGHDHEGSPSLPSDNGGSG